MQVSQKQSGDVGERNFELVETLDGAATAVKQQLFFSRCHQDAGTLPFHHGTGIACAQKSDLHRVCEYAGRGQADCPNQQQKIDFSRQLLHESAPTIINLRVRRLGLGGNVCARFHELNNGVGKLRGPGFSAYVASELVFGAIDLFQPIMNLVRRMVFAEMAQH